MSKDSDYIRRRDESRMNVRKEKQKQRDSGKYREMNLLWLFEKKWPLSN